jgi:hypothetical protein
MNTRDWEANGDTDVSFQIPVNFAWRIPSRAAFESEESLM